MRWFDYVTIAAVLVLATWAAGYVVGCFMDAAGDSCALCSGTGLRKVEGANGAHRIKCPACAGTGHRSCR